MASTVRFDQLRSYRARSWLQAVSEANSDDARFIFLWVAFNSLYGQRRAHDWLDVDMFLGKVLHDDAERIRKDLQDLHDEAIALLGLEFLYYEYWARGLTDLVAETITRHIIDAEFNWDAKAPDKSLVPIFERLYILRNQVFHGSAKFRSSKNRHSLAPAVHLLERLVSTFCEIVADDERDSKWGPPPNIPKGAFGHPRDTRTRHNLLYAAVSRGRR
jgi:hypothetical protein